MVEHTRIKKNKIPQRSNDEKVVNILPPNAGLI